MKIITAVTLLLALAPAGTPPDSGRCVVVDGAGRCLVAAADPARLVPGPRRPAPAQHNPKRIPSAAASPPPKPPLVALPIGTGWTLGPIPALPGLVPAAPVAAAPAPGVLAQRAVQLLRLPRPAVQFSAAHRAYVGNPLWLWLVGGPANVGPVSATATAGAAQVTATARLARTVWSMGPPGAVVRCAGSGTPWSGQPGPSPDCGYTYSERSLPQRTAGSGTWTVTVTAVWQVTWDGVSGGAPVAGTQVLQLESARTLPVGELQVLVVGDGR